MILTRNDFVGARVKLTLDQIDEGPFKYDAAVEYCSHVYNKGSGVKTSNQV